jgi:hypothetical protein
MFYFRKKTSFWQYNRETLDPGSALALY